MKLQSRVVHEEVVLAFIRRLYTYFLRLFNFCERDLHAIRICMYMYKSKINSRYFSLFFSRERTNERARKPRDRNEEAARFSDKGRESARDHRDSGGRGGNNLIDPHDHLYTRTRVSSFALRYEGGGGRVKGNTGIKRGKGAEGGVLAFEARLLPGVYRSAHHQRHFCTTFNSESV